MILEYLYIIIPIILVLLVLNILSNLFPKFILGIIIILFFVVFVINISELKNYTDQHVISIKDEEKLKKYCRLDKYKIFNYDFLFDKGSLILFILYLILFILLWSNKLVNDITNNTLNSEIKIIGFHKYYNKEIYKNYNYEYECLYAIMLFVAISTLIYGFNFIYYNFMGFNKKENDVIENLNIITSLIKENYNKSFITHYTQQSISQNNINKIFDTYFTSIMANANTSKLITDDPNKFYLKTHITYKLFEMDARKIIGNAAQNLLDDNYCIFELFSDKNISQIFPSNFEIIKKLKENINKNVGTNKMDDTVIRNNYSKFVDNITSNYNNIKTYEKTNKFNYKVDLLFTKFTGVLFSLFAIIFFIKTEFKQLFKIIGFTIDPLEYTIDKYNTLIKISILIIIFLFISILFNS